MGAVTAPINGPFDTADGPVTLIRPRRVGGVIEMRELWRYRELLVMLVVRDIRVRFKQTFLGAAWAIIRPVVSMVVFSVFFGGLLGVSKRTGDVPYPIFVYAGLLGWQFFATTIQGISNSIIGNVGILKKVYVPRLIFPLAVVGTPAVDFMLAFGIFCGLMVWYGVPFSLPMLLVIPLLVLIAMVALGIGLVLTSLAVWYRDFAYAVPFLIQTCFFVTPVIFPVKIVPDQYQWLLSLNPMFGIIETFRAVMLAQPVDWPLLATSAMAGAVCLAVGLWVFRTTERMFADVV
jgi:lipopolysaccharide transport system permease protein